MAQFLHLYDPLPVHNILSRPPTTVLPPSHHRPTNVLPLTPHQQFHPRSESEIASLRHIVCYLFTCLLALVDITLCRSTCKPTHSVQPYTVYTYCTAMHHHHHHHCMGYYCIGITTEWDT